MDLKYTHEEMTPDVDEQLVHFLASFDGPGGRDAGARLARRFAIGSLVVTVTVAIASALGGVCARCPGGEVSHVASAAGLRG